jgi:hypothetical protein
MTKIEKILREEHTKLHHSPHPEILLKLLKSIAQKCGVKGPVSAVDYDMTYEEWYEQNKPKLGDKE